MPLPRKAMRFHETARDLIAFGSIPFLVLTVIRVSFIGEPYYPFEIVLAAAVFFALKAVFKAETHAGIGLILAVFVSGFYRSPLFAVFAALVYAGLVASLFHLERGREGIARGVGFGAAATGVSWLVTRALFFRGA